MPIEPFGVDNDRDILPAPRRIPTRELEARQAIADEPTTGETLAANMRQAFTPVVLANNMRMAFQTPEVGFDIQSDQAKELTAGLSTNDYIAAMGSKSIPELRMRVANIKQEHKDDRTLSQQGILGGLATGTIMMAGDPFVLGAAGLTGRVLKGIGTTAYRRVGINAASVGIEVGLVEGMYRSIGSENYESVPVTAGAGIIFGAGFSAVGEWIGKSSSGAKERFAADMERYAVNDDVVTNPGMGSLREYYEDTVAIPTRETLGAPEFTGDTSFGEQGKLFGLETTWSTGDTGHPRYQPTQQTETMKKGTLKNNFRDSILHYVKSPANPKKPTKGYTAARKIANRIAGRVAEVSNGRYDTTDLVSEIIDDSLKTGNRSDATMYGRSDNDGLTKGERWTKNTVPDGIFVTPAQAKRISEGRATTKDLESLEKAVDARVAEYERVSAEYDGWVRTGTGPKVTYQEVKPGQTEAQPGPTTRMETREVVDDPIGDELRKSIAWVNSLLPNQQSEPAFRGDKRYQDVLAARRKGLIQVSEEDGGFYGSRATYTAPEPTVRTEEYEVEIAPDRGEQVPQPEYVNMEPKWVKATDLKQPMKEYTIRDNFEAMYDRTMSADRIFGKGIDEKKLTPDEKAMIGDEQAKDIAIGRSIISAWLGKISGSRLTGSTMNILLGKAADGTIDKRVAVLLSKFDTLIYRLKGANGEPLEADVNAADIREELNQVFGLNQAYKYEAYARYKKWWSEQTDLEGEMLTEDGYDARITQMYMQVYSEFEGRVADNMNALYKNPEMFMKVSKTVDDRLNATKPVDVEVVDETTGKKINTTEDVLVDDRYAAAKEESPEAAEAYRDAEMEIEFKNMAEADVDPIAIMKEYPDIMDFDRIAMEADIEFYRYYANRAKKNGLDSKGSWSQKMYQRQAVDKDAIVNAEDLVEVQNLFYEGIRRHRTYQNAVADTANRMRGRFQNADGVPRTEQAKKYAKDIEEKMVEMAKIGSVNDVTTYNAIRSVLNSRLEWFMKFNSDNQAVNELVKEVTRTMNLPGKLANEILTGAQNTVNLKDSSFDIKFGGPGFLKQRTLSIDSSVPGLDRYMDMGSQRNLAAYDYQIRGQMATKEVFGTTNKEVFLDEQSKQINMDQNTKDMLGDMFDIVLGDKQIPNDPTSWSEQVAKAANKFTFLTSGGGFLKYAVSELGVISARNGFKNTMREIPEAMRIMKDLYAQMQTGRIDFSKPETRDLFAFGEVFELYSRRMKSAFSDMSAADALMDSNSRGKDVPLGRTNDKLSEWQQGFYKWTGLEGGTMITKMVAARSFMRRLGDVVIDGKVTDVELGRWGFHDADLVKLRGELEGVGYTNTGLADFQFDKWKDKAFASKMRRVITRASRDTILRNEDLRKPTWMSAGDTYPIFKTTKLFMSFQLMSQERLLMGGMSDGASKVAAGMLTTASMLGMAYAIGEMTAVALGAKEEDKAVLPWGENAPKFYRQLAVMNSYSGNWGMAGQAFGFRNWDGGIAQGKFGASYRDVSMFFGGAPVSKMFGILDNVGGETIELMSGGEPSGKKFFNGLKSATPGNNHWMFDAAIKGMGYKAFGDDED